MFQASFAFRLCFNIPVYHFQCSIRGVFTALLENRTALLEYLSQYSLMFFFVRS